VNSFTYSTQVVIFCYGLNNRYHTPHKYTTSHHGTAIWGIFIKIFKSGI